MTLERAHARAGCPVCGAVNLAVLVVGALLGHHHPVGLGRPLGTARLEDATADPVRGCLLVDGELVLVVLDQTEVPEPNASVSAAREAELIVGLDRLDDA